MALRILPAVAVGCLSIGAVSAGLRSGYSESYASAEVWLFCYAAASILSTILMRGLWQRVAIFLVITVIVGKEVLWSPESHSPTHAHFSVEAFDGVMCVLATLIGVTARRPANRSHDTGYETQPNA